MLSQNDRRTLAAIEERLRTESPDLAQLLERFDRWAPVRHRRRHRAAWCLVVLSLALAALAFALHSADALFVSVMLLMFALAQWTVIAARASARRRSADTRIER